MEAATYSRRCASVEAPAADLRQLGQNILEAATDASRTFLSDDIRNLHGPNLARFERRTSPRERFSWMCCLPLVPSLIQNLFDRISALATDGTAVDQTDFSSSVAMCNKGISSNIDIGYDIVFLKEPVVDDYWQQWNWRETHTITQEADRSTASLAVVSQIGRALARRLGELPFVDAVFVVEDDDLHSVYTVVDEFADDIISAVMDAEEKVESVFSGYLFDFRVRAAQGRAPSEVVPINAEPVFQRK